MNSKSIDIKKLLDEIVEEEKEKHDLTFDFHYVGKLNFVKNMNKIYKRKLKLSEKNEIIKCSILHSDGFQNYNENIIVVYKRLKRMELSNLTYLIYAVYHEIGHAKDNCRDYMDMSNYDDLIYFIDHCLLVRKNEYYTDNEYHDSLGFEILADMYGIKKTKEFFEKHPEIKCDEEWLNKKEKVIYERYSMYNLAQRIDEIINCNYIYNDHDIRKSSLFSIFLKDDGTFKHIDDILKDHIFHELDQRIINGFLKSENFKKSLLDSDISQGAQDYLGNLYGSMKSKKLVIQKQEKSNNINDEIKKNKIMLAQLLGLHILQIVEWGISWILFKDHPEIYNFFELFNIGMLGTLLFSDITLVKEIINVIKYKYNLERSISEDDIGEFIGILDQKQQDNHGKSL